MTASTLTRTSAYPTSVEDLLPHARTLTEQSGTVPSRNRLMKKYRIGAAKADAMLDVLRAEQATAPTHPHPDPVPAAPDLPTPAPTDADAPAEPDAPSEATPANPPRALDTSDDGPAVPGPVSAPPVDRPRRGLWRRRRHANRSAEVVPDGHPGTEINPAPGPVGPDDARQLKRIRWGVRAVLALGVAASIAGNVLHARDELISQIISAWSPLALLLTIELISRVPVHRRTLALSRWAATALIASIAAWVSYWHMAAVAARYGETNGSQYLLPLSVDGLVVVASICLVEIGGRLATTRTLRTR